MNMKIAYAGLDVHKNSITAALFIEQKKEEDWVKKLHPIKNPTLVYLINFPKFIIKCIH